MRVHRAQRRQHRVQYCRPSARSAADRAAHRPDSLRHSIAATTTAHRQMEMTTSRICTTFGCRICAAARRRSSSSSSSFIASVMLSITGVPSGPIASNHARRPRPHSVPAASDPQLAALEVSPQHRLIQACCRHNGLSSHCKPRWDRSVRVRSCSGHLSPINPSKQPPATNMAVFFHVENNLVRICTVNQERIRAPEPADGMILFSRSMLLPNLLCAFAQSCSFRCALYDGARAKLVTVEQVRQILLTSPATVTRK